MSDKIKPSQIKAVNKYVAKSYDRLNIFVPRGCKSLIEEAGKAEGFTSVNGFVVRAILDKMNLPEWPSSEGTPGGEILDASQGADYPSDSRKK